MPHPGAKLFGAVGATAHYFWVYIWAFLIPEMKMKALYTILLLTLSNTFMTFAWYGHLKFKDMEWGKNLPLLSIIVISWGIAFFEYLLQVPANRMGYKNNGGPFSLVELKVIQEVITLVVFASFSLVFFKTESFRWNHLVGFALLVGAVYFIFKKQPIIYPGRQALSPVLACTSVPLCVLPARLWNAGRPFRSRYGHRHFPGPVHPWPCPHKVP